MDWMNVILQALVITVLITMLMIITEFINVRLTGKEWLKKPLHPLLQILLAALIGLIPGCVGIFIVISLFTHKKLNFAALLAACITTLGDEVFFMFAFMPSETVYMMLIVLLTAVITGTAVHYIASKQNCCNRTSQPPCVETFNHHCAHEHKHHSKTNKLWLYKLLFCGLLIAFMVGALTGILSDSQDFCGLFSHSTHETEVGAHAHHHAGHGWENIAFSVLSGITLLLVFRCDHHFFEEHIWQHILRRHLPKIFAWVLGVMLFIAGAMYFFDIHSFLENDYGKYILLLTALLIGFIPQSGPHLIILFLFLNGLIPFTTLLANSILQEGHGGLALIASDPKKLILIKLIKLILAASVGLLGM